MSKPAGSAWAYKPPQVVLDRGAVGRRERASTVVAAGPRRTKATSGAPDGVLNLLGSTATVLLAALLARRLAGSLLAGLLAAAALLELEAEELSAEQELLSLLLLPVACEDRSVRWMYAEQRVDSRLAR